MFGGLYRTQSDLNMESVIKFKDIVNPIENRITSNLDNEEISFDYQQVVRLRLKYDDTYCLTLLLILTG